tara:strand:- start:477 stop:1001 length:525 start_codon:yes stop_codon:yes gene_type:complete
MTKIDNNILTYTYLIWRFFSHITQQPNTVDQEHFWEIDNFDFSNRLTWPQDTTHISHILQTTAVNLINQSIAAINETILTPSTVASFIDTTSTTAINSAALLYDKQHSQSEFNGTMDIIQKSGENTEPNPIKIGLCLASITLLLWNKYQNSEKNKLFKVDVNGRPAIMTSMTSH